jgi:hypothetical protein
VKKAKNGLNAVLRARETLLDRTASPVPREERALTLLKEALEKRGGSLDVETSPTGTKVVVGTVCVSAGPATKEKMVAVGESGKVTTKVLKETKGIDEEVVQKAQGFGAGALQVSYKVDAEGNTEYVLQTNGSRACMAENVVNVAMALVGAAEIVEEMLRPAAGAADVVKLEQKAA